MKILETEIDFDFYDAMQMKKFEANADEMSEKIKRIKPNEMKQSEFVIAICEIVEQGFNNIFGENISEKIFKGKKNFKLCIQAYRDLVKAREQQEKEVLNEIEGLQKEIQNISYNYSTERIK